MREVDRIGNRISVRGINRDELVPLPHLKLAANLQILPRAPLLPNASLPNHLHKRTRAAVENGQLQIVEFDNRVIDAHPDECRKHVLGGGNEHALLHETGRVADASLRSEEHTSELQS